MTNEEKAKLLADFRAKAKEIMAERDKACAEIIKEAEALIIKDLKEDL